MSKKIATSFFLFSIFLAIFSSGACKSDYIQNECLKVPIADFVGSLQSVLGIIRDVTSTISNFGNFFGDFRLRNAVNDCLDLLDSSSDQLSWSMSASQNPKGKHNSTGDLGSDLKTWLSAAFVNQGTCTEGFEGTNGILKALVGGGLNQITSQIQELLSTVDSKPNSVAKNGKNDDFPSWVKQEDRKLLVVKGMTPDVVVAADGTGNFTKIMDAVLAAPDYSMRRYIIYVKKGVYNEYVELKKKKWNLMMFGDGMGITVISGNRNYIDGWTTFRTATFAVSGRGFIAQDITFENTAGPAKHQAVALRSDSDLSVFYRCEFRGYQDTLYTHTMRQFYRECRISGTVDFIFGDATAVFQNCQIRVRKGLPNQKNTITAHGRKDMNQPTGYSIQFSNISADIDLLPYVNSTYSYLGRPWKNYSRTVVMQSYLSNVIRPEGWLEWNGNLYLDSLYYGEYSNFGPGAGLGKRVKWPGYHVFNSSYEANNFTVSQFIDGNLWLPSTGVKYTAGFGV
ncbi:pectinesterase/pectinesterase inhibitor PPE8B [Mercurialis annua]|uniref:pectinesterase/pectinesterase inhibitor PPE8B n=1 Tax=Mercurialis annua TaxID=3986 RepID=UPI00215DD8E7|nr:pectinesterase/pectinesterase inhibitor PPE8B [Mercurialis annua]